MLEQSSSVSNRSTDCLRRSWGQSRTDRKKVVCLLRLCASLNTDQADHSSLCLLQDMVNGSNKNKAQLCDFPGYDHRQTGAYINHFVKAVITMCFLNKAIHAEGGPHQTTRLARSGR